MQISRLVKVAPILAASLVIAACPDRRPTWSLDEAAVDTLELERGFKVVEAIPTEWPAPGCQMVVTAVSGGSAPAIPQDVESWRTWLREVDSTEVECVGGCADGANCLLHYHLKYRGAEAAKTNCSCKPREPKPCALNLEWTLGTRTRRSIQRLWCEAAGGSATASCGLIFAFSGDRLELTCSSRESIQNLDFSSKNAVTSGDSGSFGC